MSDVESAPQRQLKRLAKARDVQPAALPPSVPPPPRSVAEPHRVRRPSKLRHSHVARGAPASRFVDGEARRGAVDDEALSEGDDDDDDDPDGSCGERRELRRIEADEHARYRGFVVGDDESSSGSPSSGGSGGGGDGGRLGAAAMRAVYLQSLQVGRPLGPRIVREVVDTPSPVDAPARRRRDDNPGSEFSEGEGESEEDDDDFVVGDDDPIEEERWTGSEGPPSGSEPPRRKSKAKARVVARAAAREEAERDEADALAAEEEAMLQQALEESRAAHAGAGAASS